MNRLYIIIPLLLLAIFGGFYWNYSSSADEIAAAEAVKSKIAAMEEAALKEAAERKAREDAEERRQEREAVEKAKEVERQAAWQEGNRKIAEDTVRYSEQAEKNRIEVERLKADLAAVRDNIAATGKERFSIHAEIEQRKSRQRAAGIEYQRLLSMTIAKLNSALTAAPASAKATQ